jgi:hypothetical protein
MLLYRHQNVGQNRDMKIANRSFENVLQLKYLGATVTNQNLIQEEIKRRLNSGNACYHSVQNLLSYRLLSKNLNVRIYKTTILPSLLYGCETWSLTLREEHRLRVKHDNHVTSFATILSCVNIAHVFIFTTCFGYSEPSSGETKYNTPNIQSRLKL